jgi:hypothetical protein
MRKFLAFALVTLVVMIVAGCGGSDTPYVPIKTGGNTPQPDFTVSVQQVTPTQVLQLGQGAPEVSPKSKAKPGSQSDGGANFTVTVTPINGFTGSVSLQASSDQNATGFATNFTPASVTLTGPQPVTSTFSVELNSNVNSGQYSFAVTGTSSSSQHTASVHPLVSVQGLPGTFTMSISPDTIQDLQLDEPGVNKSFTVTLTSVNGFAGTVNLSVANPLPSEFSDALSKSSVTLTSGSSTTVTMTVTLTTRGDDIFEIPERFVVTGTSGTTQAQVAGNVQVED